MWLNNKEIDVSNHPDVLSIASFRQALITRKRTTIHVKLTSTLYGLTKSREIVDIL